MSDIVEQAKAEVARIDGRDGPFCVDCNDYQVGVDTGLVMELIAEIERLHSWDGLMSLVDEHYPEDIFPTMEDRPNRDPGPRIVSLLRTVDELRNQERP